MSSIFVELKPDRSLLDPSFAGYNLSLDPIPVYKKSLPADIEAIKLSDDQYFFLHLKLFSFHNHLYVNPYSREQVFLIDKNQKVYQIMLTALNHIDSLKEVCEIPSNIESQEGDYNVSLVFASNSLVVMSDGKGTIHIADIDSNGKWQIKHSTMTCEEGVKFVLVEAKLNDGSDKQNLHVIVTYIEDDTEQHMEKKGRSCTSIEWFAFIQNSDNVWSMEAARKIICDEGFEYLALESDCKGVMIIAKTFPKFTFDSVNPVEEKPINMEVQTKEYVWSQTIYNLTVVFPVSNDVKKTDFRVNIENGSIEMYLKQKLLLSGELNHKVEKDLSTWVLEDCKCELHLIKEEVGVMWDEVVVGDDRGECVADPLLVQEIHRGLAHLCSDKEEYAPVAYLDESLMEECGTFIEDMILVRLDCESHLVTHQVHLPSKPWLCKVYQSPDKVPAMCLRHNLDACIWQFESPQGQEWPYKHISTLSAFGYIEASKTEKKFIVIPPDCSYAAVCDVVNHVYIYRQPSPVQGDLRHRPTGQRVETVAKQQIINLDVNDEIFGAHAFNSLLYILTKKAIRVFVINQQSN